MADIRKASLFFEIGKTGKIRDREFEQIEKYNKNHGRDGRFTSGGGSSASGSRKHYSQKDLDALAEHLPGVKSQPVVYADDNVAIRRGNSGVHVYHNVEYSSPLRGLPTEGWLSSGAWDFRDGKYHQLNGFGRSTGKTANNYQEIADCVRNE